MCKKWKISTDISEKEIRVLETEITHFVSINIPGVIFSVKLELTPARGVRMDSRPDWEQQGRRSSFPEP